MTSATSPAPARQAPGTLHKSALPSARRAADVCALGRLVTRVCAMTFAVVARLIYQTLLARMSAGQ
jgi:hypothetical protein